MLVKVTTPMYKILRSHIQESFPGYSITIEKFNPDTYARYVDADIYRNEVDYSPKTGKFSVLRVQYPDEYYAMPSYITTRDLARLFSSSDKTWNGFLRQIDREIEI